MWFGSGLIGSVWFGLVILVGLGWVGFGTVGFSLVCFSSVWFGLVWCGALRLCKVGFRPGYVRSGTV